MTLAQSHNRAVVKQANYNDTKQNTLHNLKLKVIKNITFVNQITFT